MRNTRSVEKVSLEACSAPPRPVLENVRAHFGGAARSCLHAFCMLRRLCLERHKVEGVDRIRCEHGWLSVRGKSGRVFLRPMLAGVVARTKSAGVVARTKSAGE